MTKRPILIAQLLAATVLLAGSLPTFAASNICDFHGFSDDSDPAGTNVRSGPGISYGVIGVLLPETVEETYSFTPEFEVQAFDNGWFQIGDASFGDYGFGEKQVFNGPGWVSAKLVDFDIEDPMLRDGPSLDAATILYMHSIYDPANAWNLDEVRVQTVHACEGGFLDVTVTNLSGESKRGWVTDLCGSQVTTCP